MIRATLACTAFILMTTLTSGASAADLKIGYVDMARALNEVNDGKSAKAKLKRDFEKKQKKLDKMQKDLKAEKDEFDAKKGMMKPDVRAQKQESMQRKLLELQQVYVQLQQELMGEETKVTQTIGGKIRTVVEKIGDRDGYHLVLDIGDGVLYFKRHHDLTAVVVKEYNRQFGK